MLRYIEQSGLVVAPRSRSGYRLYGPAELRRLGTLRELLTCHKVSLDNVGFALRMRRDPQLSAALESWLQAAPRESRHVATTDWLRWEQEKHQRLLTVA